MREVDAGSSADGGDGCGGESSGDGARLAGYFLDWSDLTQYICGGKKAEYTGLLTFIGGLLVPFRFRRKIALFI